MTRIWSARTLFMTWWWDWLKWSRTSLELGMKTRYLIAREYFSTYILFKINAVIHPSLAIHRSNRVDQNVKFSAKKSLVNGIRVLPMTLKSNCTMTLGEQLSKLWQFVIKALAIHQIASIYMQFYRFWLFNYFCIGFISDVKMDLMRKIR